MAVLHWYDPRKGFFTPWDFLPGVTPITKGYKVLKLYKKTKSKLLVAGPTALVAGAAVSDVGKILAARRFYQDNLEGIRDVYSERHNVPHYFLNARQPG